MSVHTGETGHGMAENIFTFLLVGEDGTSHEHHHRMADTDTVGDVVRAALGGWLEHIRVTDPALALWCDEEGRMRGRAANPVGSRLVLAARRTCRRLRRPDRHHRQPPQHHGEPHRGADRAAPRRAATVPPLTAGVHRHTTRG